MNSTFFRKTFHNIKNNCSIFRTVYLVLIFTFCFLPLVLLFFNISGEDLNFIFSDPTFFKSIGNSILYTSISTIISCFLALMSAYFLSRSNLNKKVFILLFTVPMLIPTLSIGLGFRTLLGTNGFLSKIFNINVDSVGYLGLILGSVVISFPPAFLILFDAFKYENKVSYDAAEIIGINKASTFFKVTLPYIYKPLITTFLASFTLIFSDYGIPMELAGKIKTLPMYLYEQITAVYKYGRGAFVGFVLLLPAIVSFVVDLFLKDESFGESSKSNLKSSTLFNVLSLIFCIIVALFVSVPELCFAILSFLKGFPNNISLTFENFSYIFSSTKGIGLGNYIINSLLMSFLTGILGTIFAYTMPYLSTRIPGKYGKLLNFLSVSTIAVPGIVLGVGYIFLFKETKGFFYGTLMILVVVNIIHFFGSPYIMAKNCFSKMNKNYEIVGKSLGINKTRIFFKVLIPNSLSTLVEMFSYFFLNSMITISAVAFLSTYSTQPLSILITTFEKTGNYEMQAVISFIILIINIIFKFGLDFVVRLLNKEKGGSNFMRLTRYQFNLLTYLEKNGRRHYTQRMLSDSLSVSLGTINNLLNEMTDLGYVSLDLKKELFITEKGLSALEPYRVKKAIILAAGFGSRLAPVTLDTPKPLIKIKGTRIIDTLIDALIEKGIENIVLVVGYKKEKFNILLEKYPFLQFVTNENFNVTNNISSLITVIDKVENCYICEADLYITNKDLINKYEFSTNYLGAKVNETDDWCFNKNNGYISSYKMGGTDCYQAFGISYWDEIDSEKLRNHIEKTYNSKGGKDMFWENVPLNLFKKYYQIEIKKCHKEDIIEIDNFNELVSVDDSYSTYPGVEGFR